MTLPTDIDGRLEALRQRGAFDLTPLWADRLAAGDALAELAGGEGPLNELQRARCLLRVGRREEAAETLRALGELPRGLEPIRQELVAAAEPVPDEAPSGDASPRGISTKTLAELYAGQGDVSSAAATYREILERDPSDALARERLQDLIGEAAPPEAPPPVAALEGWLANTRLWRQTLGV